MPQRVRRSRSTNSRVLKLDTKYSVLQQRSAGRRCRYFEFAAEAGLLVANRVRGGCRPHGGNSGGGGIRTHEPPCEGQRFSRPPAACPIAALADVPHGSCE